MVPYAFPTVNRYNLFFYCKNWSLFTYLQNPVINLNLPFSFHLLLFSLLLCCALFLSFSQFFSPPPVHLWRIGSSPHLCTSFLSLTLPFLFLISPASLFFYYLSLLLLCSAIPSPRLRSLCSTLSPRSAAPSPSSPAPISHF